MPGTGSVAMTWTWTAVCRRQGLVAVPSMNEPIDFSADGPELVGASEFVGHPRVERPSGLLSRLFATLSTDEEMFSIVEDLRALRVRTALLSNNWGST
ncbi:hypothetical protein [Streptomyces hygroscopicus]|uniref:hypothetical protein n=1 Tax=Streptomyces hygroscopicus TaxID=1912 RepID=UPI00223FC9D6|nr:hypothetical protein [Streptomyces hygroscopicus]